ncbi:LysE family translocator [Pseudaestuariivita sp.]|uniref:LysE family translocator n=1 Tax=Pseudaestuariivita sp. TaxID=2211669 RepID=UPI004057FC3D
MVPDVNLPLILFAALIAASSPGPATLALAGTSMASGRAAGLALAAGITTGSLMWSVAAALGLGAIMLANAWAFEVIRYCGAAYLMFLAYKAARSALTAKALAKRTLTGRPHALYVKGLALHLTNPKAVLFFGALFSVGVPPGTEPKTLATVILAVGLQSCVVFHGYAFLFSSRVMTDAYLRLRRWLEAVFAVGFGAASVSILTSKLHAS